MVSNPRRRAALVDAAIEVLAREGARGLTFRAVDTEAGVPGGTTSNYFADRDDLFTHAGGRIYERLQPDPAAIAASLQGPRDQHRVVALIGELVDRVVSYRSGYLALLELRLEATRRPELRAVLTRTIRADIEANISYHLDTGLPGDATTVVLLYLAVNWLIVERLTLPEVFPESATPDLVAEVVGRIPPGAGAPGGQVTLPQRGCNLAAGAARPGGMQVTLDAATGGMERLAEVVSRWEPARPLRADEVEFERFFREHQRGVYVFALHLLGDPLQAEDVASEVLVKVYLRSRGGRVANPKAYLRRAVVNHTHSWLRRKQVERRYLERQQAEPVAVDTSVGRVDDAQVLTGALRELPPRQRAAIVLRFYEDLSEAETADVLGCSVGTVKSQVHRGSAKLREVVGPEVFAGGER